MYLEKRHREKVYFFFDEIQIFSQWELFVGRLRREEESTYYYKIRQGYEVNFLAIPPDGGKMLVQACELLEDETTKAREVRALTAAMEETNVRHGRILTENYHEDIKVSVRTIHCVPAPYFLMEREFPSL